MDECEKKQFPSALERCFEDALEQVLRVKTLHVEDCPGNLSEADERAVAALDFFGDFKGRIVLTLRENQLEQIAHLIQEIFMTGAQLEHSLVFAEILNIYVGCLAVQMQKLGYSIDIAPPLRLEEGCSQWLCAKETRMIKMVTDGKLEFKFRLFLQ